MTHAELIHLLATRQDTAQWSSLDLDAITRLDRYHALLNAAIGYLQLVTTVPTDDLLRAIEEAIK